MLVAPRRDVVPKEFRSPVLYPSQTSQYPQDCILYRDCTLLVSARTQIGFSLLFAYCISRPLRQPSVIPSAKTELTGCFSGRSADQSGTSHFVFRRMPSGAKIFQTSDGGARDGGARVGAIVYHQVFGYYYCPRTFSHLTLMMGK